MMTERPEILIMIKLAGEGKTTREIAQALNDAGIRLPRRDYAWTASHVSSMLSNRKVAYKRMHENDAQVTSASRKALAWDFSGENINTGGL